MSSFTLALFLVVVSKYRGYFFAESRYTNAGWQLAFVNWQPVLYKMLHKGHIGLPAIPALLHAPRSAFLLALEPPPYKLRRTHTGTPATSNSPFSPAQLAHLGF
jgi:hypothetical protein